MAVNVDFKNLTDAQAAWMAAVNSDIASIKSGMDSLTELPDFIEGVINREYGYTHTAVVTNDLEKDYNLIVNGGYQRLYNPPIDWETEYANYYYLDNNNYVSNNSVTWDWDKEYYKLLEPHYYYKEINAEPVDWGTKFNTYYVLVNDQYVLNDNSEWDSTKTYYSKNSFSTLSAVGLFAILKEGDTVTTQDEYLFINGIEEQSDYSFNGTNSQGGVEFVKIWYFENEGSLSLQKLDMTVTNIIEKTISATPVLSADFYDYVSEIEYDTAPAAIPMAVRKQRNMAGGTFSDKVSTSVEEYESNCVTLPNINTGNLKNYLRLKKVSFPCLTTISGGASDGFFKGCTSLTEFYFPMLETIAGVTSNASAPFNGVPKVVIPESVQTIGAKAFYSNGEIVLNCKKAQSINANFCVTTPSQSFTMCPNWEASINIAVAAKNWAPEKFGIPSDPNDMSYLYNLLKDYGNTWVEDAHEITIPDEYYTNELKEYYKNKNWTLKSL